MKPAVVRVPDVGAAQAARLRQDSLTKPAGALGVLETVVVQLAGLQGRSCPSPDPARFVVFAADHGVAAQGVSAYPQAVTLEMVRNFARGGAAICVLARAQDATLEVVDVGVCTDPGPLPGVVAARVAAGSMDLSRGPALDPAQLDAALAAGGAAVERAMAAGARLFVGGEMGIGNTTAAAAVGCGLLGLPAAELVGPGTGVDGAGLARKVAVVDAALALHQPSGLAPLEVLRRLGGLEIAALAGAYLACARLGLPALVDGFVTGAAALAAVRHCPEVAPWLLYGHVSAEPGHRRLLQALQARPLLDLGMRLGEGSGAATALALLRLACRLHAEMATFEQAGVSGRAP